jgi:hypothetical protein
VSPDGWEDLNECPECCGPVYPYPYYPYQSGTSAGGGGTIATGCCPGRLLPDVLYATVSSTCGLIDDQTVTLNHYVLPNEPPGDGWTGSISVTCSNCTTFTVDVRCEYIDGEYQWAVNATIAGSNPFPAQPCTFTEPPECTISNVQCDPFLLVFDCTLPSYTPPGCCDGQSFTVTVTE